MALPGAPRDIYLARMEWAASSETIIMQHLNRLQNTLTLLLGDAKTGRTTPIMVERDSAWVDAVDDWQWLPDGSRFRVAQRPRRLVPRLHRLAGREGRAVDHSR